MAYRIVPFAVTIPAGTLKTAPVTIPLNLDNWEIEALDLEVPPGPAGLMGFQIANNGVPYIPYGAGQWLVWDDVKERYQLDEQPNASGWAIIGYNLGTYDHQVIARFHVNRVSNQQTTPAPRPLIIVNGPQPPTPTIVL
jgi:hypothetical protein